MENTRAAGMSYPEFYDLFTEVGQKGVRAWQSLDPMRQASGMANTENAMAQANAYYSGYLDRLALLGPALGGTVIIKTQDGTEI